MRVPRIKDLPWWARVLALVVAIVLATWAIEAFLSRAGGEWDTAIPAVATIVLVAVTAWYVALTRGYVSLTRELLDVQRDQFHELRRSGSIEACREVAGGLFTKAYPPLLAAKRVVPLGEESAFPDTGHFAEHADALHGISVYFASKAAGLPPEMSDLCWTAADRTMFASRMLGRLEVAVLLAHHMATKEDREPGWEDAKAAYYLNLRAEGDPEWGPLLAGEATDDAEDAVDELRDALSDFLRSLHQVD